MSLDLHIQAEKAFNKNAFDLIAFLEEKASEAIIANDPIGSRADKLSDDWSDKIADAPIRISETSKGESIDIFEQYRGRSVGFNTTEYPKFEKFIKSIYKMKSISDKVSYDFLYDNTFRWLVDVHKTKRAEEEFVSYLNNRIAEVTGNFTYSFKILNLDIQKKFNLGKVEFEYLEASYFDKMEEKKSLDDVNALREKLQGMVYASCTIMNVERSRGVNLALQECYKAMDVLKLFSPTIIRPKHRTYFDIDNRVTVSEEQEYIIRDRGDFDQFNINLAAGAKPYELKVETIDDIVISAKNFVFLISLKQPNELQKLILNGLSRLSEAISNPNIHRRLVDLFTIWEAFLLKNNSVNIQDSIIEYGAAFMKIKDKDKIVEFKSFIMSMYDIRSQVVHHANHKEIDLQKMSQLQIYTIHLIEDLIGLSVNYPTKAIAIEAYDNFIVKNTPNI